MEDRTGICAKLLIFGFAFGIGGLGCGDSSTGNPDAAAEDRCGMEGRWDRYSAGLSKNGAMNLVSIAFMDAMPAPPDRGDNEWMFLLSDKNGQPIDGATIRVRAWMPDHGHGTTPEFHDAPSLNTPGGYSVGPFNLFMAGFWEFTFTAELSDGQSDEAKFGFCVRS